MRADLIKEMTVMGNNDNRTVKLYKELLEPGNCINIKVVRRLVHKKDIGIAEKSLRKKHLDLDFITKLAHLCIVKFVCNAETVKENFRIAFCAPAAHFRKLFLKLADTDAVLLGEILLHIEGFFFVHNLAELRVTHKHGADNIVLVEGKVILTKN